MPKELTEYLENFFKNNPKFTGKLEINFQLGIIKDVNKTERTKFMDEDGKQYNSIFGSGLNVKTA
jgi:hypothetical protein